MTSKVGRADELEEGRRWWERLLPSRQSPAAEPRREPERVGDLVRAGNLVELRRHVPANRGAFQEWYADADIARLLRHDLRPLSFVQSMVYFDTVILPSSALGLTCAIHDRASGMLIGTTGLTDLIDASVTSCYFRIVIGESRFWNQGYGTEATRLMITEGFERHGIDVVNLEVFDYNQRARAAYQRVGFELVGDHIEWPEPGGPDLHVLEMRLTRDQFETNDAGE